jgi:hypothetical protein
MECFLQCDHSDSESRRLWISDETAHWVLKTKGILNRSWSDIEEQEKAKANTPRNNPSIKLRIQPQELKTKKPFLVVEWAGELQWS